MTDKFIIANQSRRRKRKERKKWLVFPCIRDRYEAAALGLPAAFVFFTAGWFFASRTASDPYTVTVQHSQSTAVSSAEQTQTGESSQPESLLEGERIPVNTADLYELDRLPGIGPTKAQAIVDYRTEHGPFQSAEQLLEVSGIGEATLEGLLDYITLD